MCIIQKMLIVYNKTYEGKCRRILHMNTVTESSEKQIVHAIDQSVPELLIVTGYSGAGKSTVLRALEDIGFFCVDNLPMALLGSFFEFIIKSTMVNKKIALGIDIRGGKNLEAIIDEINSANKVGLHKIKILFLTSTDKVLVKRFQETRRKHPLATDINLLDAIAQEKELLKPLSAMADVVLETDQLNIHQLRNYILHSFAVDQKLRLLVNLVSFGFKYGVPAESNFVFDIRSLPNPYFIPGMRTLDGTNPIVLDYLFSQPAVQEYWEKLHSFFEYSIKKSYDEGRSFVTIAIGCTGGRHRSVAFVHTLAKKDIDNVYFVVKHRDITQDGSIRPS